MKKTRNLIKCLMLVISCLLVFNFTVIEARAAIPEKINIQGVLTDDGEPVTIKTNVTLELYDNAQGTKPILLSSTSDITPNANGFFNYVWDLSAAILTFDRPYWVKIKIKDKAGSTIDLGIQPLVSVPYAITAKNVGGGIVFAEGKAQTAVTGVGSTGIGVFGLSGSNSGVYGYSSSGKGVHAYSNTDYGLYADAPKNYFSGKVGIGTINPGAKLDVLNPGGAAIKGKSTDWPGVQGESTKGIGVYGASHSNAGVKGFSTNSYGLYGQSVSGYGLYADAPKNYFSGNVGIGTDSPLSKVHVVDKDGNVAGRFVAEAANSRGIRAEGKFTGGYFIGDSWGVYSQGGAGGYFKGTDGDGVYGEGTTYGVHGAGQSTIGVYGNSTSSYGVKGYSKNSFGVYGESDSDLGVYGKSTANRGVHGWSKDSYGASGYSVNSGGVQGVGKAYGVEGRSMNGDGVRGISTNLSGVFGHSNTKYGGYFTTGALSERALGVVGKGYATKGFFTGNLDIAEWVKVNDPSIGGGDVVVLDRNTNKAVVKSFSAYSTLVAGIISTKPAFLAGGHIESSEVLGEKEMRARGYRMLALSGQVPCNVSAENGPIEIGDLLTASSTPGHAMKVTDKMKAMGAIVGKAMEPLASGKGKIIVLVTLQ